MSAEIFYEIQSEDLPFPVNFRIYITYGKSYLKKILPLEPRSFRRLSAPAIAWERHSQNLFYYKLPILCCMTILQRCFPGC